MILAGIFYARHLLNDWFDPVTTEINRVTSSDRKLDAALYTKEGDVAGLFDAKPCPASIPIGTETLFSANHQRASLKHQRRQSYRYLLD
jgi:hypothetical protein